MVGVGNITDILWGSAFTFLLWKLAGGLVISTELLQNLMWKMFSGFF